MQLQRLEEAGLNAWAPLQQMLLDGWVLRFANGYTKRANSINPVYGGALDVDQKVAICEQLYRDRGLPVIFRLTSFGAPPGLDDLLAKRGYRYIDCSLTMCADLRACDLTDAPTLREAALDNWLELFRRLSEEVDAPHLDTQRAMLQIIPARGYFASLVDAGQVVSCGLGVLEPPYCGLFNLVTAPAQRNRGYGVQLVNGMLAWAKAQGATQAYLQVLSSNAPARHVYAKAGFRDGYSYWYRVAP
jgi:N-acetylglutamate synthase